MSTSCDDNHYTTGTSSTPRAPPQHRGHLRLYLYTPLSISIYQCSLVSVSVNIIISLSLTLSLSLSLAISLSLSLYIYIYIYIFLYKNIFCSVDVSLIQINYTSIVVDIEHTNWMLLPFGFPPRIIIYKNKYIYIQELPPKKCSFPPNKIFMRC